MSVSQDEINYLVYRYLQENNFPHSAFIFETESLADSTNISSSQIPPGALITLLQKSLQYMKLEKQIREAQQDPNSPAQEGIQEIQKAYNQKEVKEEKKEGEKKEKHQKDGKEDKEEKDKK